VTVTNGGWLEGVGIIGGAVTVNAGGTLAPGNPLGFLTISNNLTLAAGGTTWFCVQHSPPTNSLVLVSGTLTEGGSLIVTNTGGMALAGGDSFNVFTAGSVAGGFAGVTLPPLPAGLGWNTNGLSASGVLSVVVATQPVINTAVITPDGLVLQGTAGVAGGNYYLLSSTNLLAPLTNWTPLLTNQFDSQGNFDFTNLLDPNAPQNFYQLQVP
jgi:hypothetical protein